jgi:Protein of unknown function (DUF2510)
MRQFAWPRSDLTMCPTGRPGDRYPPIQPDQFADPQNRCQIRYFDGAAWTHHIVGKSQTFGE